jgi:type II secretion system protein L
VRRLFISLPDPLPESLATISWRLTGGQVGHDQAADATALPAADEIWLALPAGRVLLSRLKLSRSALRQLNGALGNALEDQLMLDPASVHVALGKAGSDDSHPVAAIEIAWLEQALALCRQQGIQPAGAIPENLLWSGEDDADAWCARWSGQDGFARSGPVAGFALDDGGADAPPLALQLAMAEARRQGHAPAALMLETRAEVDIAAWSRALDCRVHLQALRPDPHAPAINLLQGAYASRRRGGGGFANLANLASGEQAGKYRLAAGLVAAALAVHVLGTAADWARLSWENRKLRDEMRQVFQETFPKTQAIVDPVLQMQRQLADMRRAHGYAESGDFLHVLSMAGGQVGGVAALSYENNRLTLEQPRATDLEGLRGALKARGYQALAATGEGGNRTISIERSQP